MEIIRACAWRACALSLLFASSDLSIAAESTNPKVQQRSDLTLAEAIDAALRLNPELLASGYELSAAQARMVQADARPNPELSMEFENFAGTGSTRSVDALETTLSLSQVLELGGKRSLRVAVTESDLQLSSVEQRARQLDVLAEVTRRFIDLVAAQERLRTTDQSVQLAQQTLDAVGARVTAARSPEAERSRARIALTRALLEQQQARSELRSARFTLAAQWGDAQPGYPAARADLFTFPALESFPALIDRLERSPDFVRFASLSRLRDAELRLARAQARPNLSLTLGMRRLEADDDMALVAGASMPLPVFDRNRGAIREAQIRRAQSDAERNAAFVSARASLFGLYQEAETARVRSETLRNAAIPQARTALEQSQYGFERGRFSFLELSIAQQELLELQQGAIDAAADHHRLRAEIERLTSEPLTVSMPQGELP
jgi:cobalt-zinc-cadmium efflux system outer membrane protein